MKNMEYHLLNMRSKACIKIYDFNIDNLVKFSS
jgi:hypothetical protein